MFEPWQLALVADCRVARLGTIASGGRPRLVPVCYALVGDEIAIAVDEKPKRTVRLARLADVDRDARVTLLVDRYEEDWARLEWVRIDGEAAALARGDEWAEGLAALRARYPQYAAMRLEDRPLMRIRVIRVTGWRAARGP